MFVAGHAMCQQIPAQFVTFFSNFAYWWPSDQSSVNMDRPIKICHVEMINCEKVRLPRQICNFCVSAVSRMESRFFVSRKCLLLHLPLQATGLLGLRFRAPNGITGRTLGEVPTGVGRTATWHMWQVSIAHWSTPFEAYSACHVAKIDTWYHLIGPRGIICHVSSAHWSVRFLMPVGVDTWQPCGRHWWDGQH
jgi:hypothetical protein